jgi:small subunit ribosomal protein S20
LGFEGAETGRPEGSRSLSPGGFRRPTNNKGSDYVASHDSALKAHRQNVVRRERNRQMRTRLRHALRDIRAAIDGGDAAEVKDALRDTISLVDKMAGKGIIHRNTAGRYKSRLSSRVAKKSAAA